MSNARTDTPRDNTVASASGASRRVAIHVGVTRSAYLSDLQNEALLKWINEGDRGLSFEIFNILEASDKDRFAILKFICTFRSFTVVSYWGTDLLHAVEAEKAINTEQQLKKLRAALEEVVLTYAKGLKTKGIETDCPKEADLAVECERIAKIAGGWEDFEVSAEDVLKQATILAARLEAGLEPDWIEGEFAMREMEVAGEPDAEDNFNGRPGGTPTRKSVKTSRPESRPIRKRNQAFPRCDDDREVSRKAAVKTSPSEAKVPKAKRQRS